MKKTNGAGINISKSGNHISACRNGFREGTTPKPKRAAVAASSSS